MTNKHDEDDLKAAMEACEKWFSNVDKSTASERATYRAGFGDALTHARSRPSLSIDQMADRFIGWPLPKTVSPDCGRPIREHDSGTNLLTWSEAKQMFEYVLGGSRPEPAGEFDEKAANEKAADIYPNVRTEKGLVRSLSEYRKTFVTGARWQHSQLRAQTSDEVKVRKLESDLRDAKKAVQVIKELHAHEQNLRENADNEIAELKHLCRTPDGAEDDWSENEITDAAKARIYGRLSPLGERELEIFKEGWWARNSRSPAVWFWKNKADDLAVQLAELKARMELTKDALAVSKSFIELGSAWVNIKSAAGKEATLYQNNVIALINVALDRITSSRGNE